LERTDNGEEYEGKFVLLSKKKDRSLFIRPLLLGGMVFGAWASLLGGLSSGVYGDRLWLKETGLREDVVGPTLCA
jgi:hypothetical protein